MLENKFDTMDFGDLVCFIQPLWNKYNMGNGSLTNKETDNLTEALKTYKSKGGDVSYFVNGSGAPDNCIIC